MVSVFAIKLCKPAVLANETRFTFYVIENHRILGCKGAQGSSGPTKAWQRSPRWLLEAIIRLQERLYSLQTISREYGQPDQEREPGGELLPFTRCFCEETQLREGGVWIPP